MNETKHYSELGLVNTKDMFKKAMAVISKVFAERPAEFDPRKYLGPAREELIKMVKHKNENVLGSANKA